VADYVTGMVETVLKIHKAEAPGDILGFLTGQEEVDRAVSLLHEYSSSTNFESKISLYLRILVYF
jgi:ATP-dependent RNA helicase DDX35